MNLNYVAIAVATLVEFVLGAIWYMPLFGDLWRRIHGIPKPTKSEMQKMQKQMMPLLIVQLFVTLVTTIVLAIFLAYQPTWNAYAMSGFFWLGFVVPTQVSAVLFGGTKPQWILPKIFVMAGASLLCLEAATVILHFWR